MNHFLLDAFLAVFFVALQVGHLHKYTFLLVGKLLSFWGKPHLSRSSSAGVVVPCAPWWVVATARWCGPIRRCHHWKIPAVDALGAQVMCFFFRCSILQKNRKNHGEDMVIQMMSLKLVDVFFLGYVLREWDEAMCYWPSFQGNWHRLQWEGLSLCSEVQLGIVYIYIYLYRFASGFVEKQYSKYSLELLLAVILCVETRLCGLMTSFCQTVFIVSR